MTTLTVHCDRCGERVLTDRTLLRVESGPLRSRRPEVDLCPQCVETWFAAALKPPARLEVVE
jgi:hypothetical protein